MKNLSIYSILVIFFFIFLEGCGKSEPVWNNDILDGKSFVISKMVQTSDNSDITTNAFLDEPCYKNTFTFIDTSYFLTKAVGCVNASGGSWSTIVNNNKNYLILKNTQLEVLSFDDNNITFNIDTRYKGNDINSNVTMTKK